MTQGVDEVREMKEAITQQNATQHERTQAIKNNL